MTAVCVRRRTRRGRIARAAAPALAAAVAAVITAAVAACSAGPASDASADPAFGARPQGAVWSAAPYLYLGGNGAPSPAQIMTATGVRRFTLAFIDSDGTCRPVWDNGDPLTGQAEAQVIRDIRAAGGDVAVSFGGIDGIKLAVTCSSPQELAGAYTAVVDAYHLRAIDLDAEAAEIGTAAVRQRMVSALGIVRQRDPGLTISVTIGADPTGPGAGERDLIKRAAAAGLRVDAWTIMPFDFADRVPDMGRASVQVAEALKTELMNDYHEQASAAYLSMGISSMNGRTDTGEIIKVSDFQTMLRYAQEHHLARFTFWSANRDRPCASAATSKDSCSGIAQEPYAFTRVVAQYRG